MCNAQAIKTDVHYCKGKLIKRKTNINKVQKCRFNPLTASP